MAYAQTLLDMFDTKMYEQKNIDGDQYLVQKTGKKNVQNINVSKERDYHYEVIGDRFIEERLCIPPFSYLKIPLVHSHTKKIAKRAAYNLTTRTPKGDFIKARQRLRNKYGIKRDILAELDNDGYFCETRLEGLENDYIVNNDILIEIHQTKEQKVEVHINCHRKEIVQFVFGDEAKTKENSSKDQWRKYKIILNNLYANKHEIYTHLVDTHLFAGMIETIMKRHPTLYIIYKPFFEYTETINGLAFKTLISKGGTFEKLFQNDYDEMMEILETSFIDLDDRVVRRYENVLKDYSVQASLCEEIKKEIKIFNSVIQEAYEDEIKEFYKDFNQNAFKTIKYSFREGILNIFLYQILCGHTVANYQQMDMYSNTIFFPTRLGKGFLEGPADILLWDKYFLDIEDVTEGVGTIDLLSMFDDDMILLNSTNDLVRKLGKRIERINKTNTRYVRKEEIPVSINI